MAPFGGDCEYADFPACVRANQDKDDPEGYCAELMRQTEEHCAKGLLPVEKLVVRAREALGRLRSRLS